MSNASVPGRPPADLRRRPYDPPVSQTTEPLLVPPPKRERRLRRFGMALASLMVLVLATIGAGGWYYANQIMAPPGPDTPARATLVSVTQQGTTATVRLRGDRLAGTPEVVG